MARLYAFEGIGPVTHDVIAGRERALRDASPIELQMTSLVLDELEALRAGRITPAQYMVNVMQHAADLARDNGHRFVELVGMAFSEVPSEDALHAAGRDVLGAGPHPVGWLLEAIQASIVREAGGYTPETGFAAGVLDVDPMSSVTHHFGELLRVGYYRGETLGDWAQDYLDGDENPGDVHNGYFAVMLGAALANGEITPQEAVQMVEAAYTGDGASFTLDPADYTLDRFRVSGS